MVEEVMVGGEVAAHVCRKYRTSRKTFYKWLVRYKEAKERGADLLRAMEDSYAEGFVHPRSVSAELQERILGIVRQYPEYSTHEIAGILPWVGNHGVQNVLRRLNLNTYEKRLAYAQEFVPRPLITPAYTPLDELSDRLRDLILLPARRKLTSLTRPLEIGLALSILLGFSLFYWIRIIAQATTLGVKFGLFFASISLTIGTFFFLYSMKYYLTIALVLSSSRELGENSNNLKEESQENHNGPFSRLFSLANGLGNNLKNHLGNNSNNNQGNGKVGLYPNLDQIELKRKPFVSIHLPFYNERRVAKRLLEACTSMDYPNYEVIVCDDSTDETTQITRRFAEKFNAENADGPKIKVLHRPTREGFKGGALKYALEKMDPRTEFVIVFDADFVPYPDTIEQFLRYFKANNPVPDGVGQAYSEDYTQSNVAVVAGYQWHVLNKSENWITRGVRSEYAGSYVIERPGREIMGGLKIIHGSVYMIRSDVLRELGWGTSITEDFELTLRLYEKGYKVVYTPYIQAPAECVSTLKRLIRQRMRWAEGHSNNIKKMFLRLMKSSKLTLMEKVEVLYLAPYYLQAAFFLIGTLSWLISETVFRAQLPFWTSLWGWSLVLTNFFALPLMNSVGLFLEESEEKDYLGIISFIATCYIVVPFQAYAAVKGFLEKEEGPWFRTPKTGKITDIFKRGTFYRWVRGILPWRVSTLAASLRAPRVAPAYVQNPYVNLKTANNRFNGFRIKPKRLRWVSKAALTVLLVISTTILSLTQGVPEVLANNWSNLYLRSGVEACTGTDAMTEAQGSANASQEISSTNAGPYYWYSPSLQTGTMDASITAGDWTMHADGTFYSGGGGSNIKFNVILDLVDAGDCSSNVISLGSATSAVIKDQKDFPDTITVAVVAQTITSANPKRIRLTLSYSSENKGAYCDINYNNTDTYDSNLQPATLTIPENIVFLVAAAPFIPMIVLWIKRRESLGSRV